MWITSKKSLFYNSFRLVYYVDRMWITWVVIHIPQKIIHNLSTKNIELSTKKY